MTNAPELQGIVLPERLGAGRPSQEAVDPWLDVVEHLIARGVTTAYGISRLLGIGRRTAASWIEQVHERWARRLSEERLNWRREALWQEADAVTRAAWQDYQSAESVRDRTGLLKVILMANQRKSAITGLDRLDVNVTSKVEQVNVNVVARVTQELGLSPEALRAIGTHASKALSKREDRSLAQSAAPGDVLDVELASGEAPDA